MTLIKHLRFDDTFLRKWDYYFSYCEAGFRSCMLANLHLVLSKSAPRLDIEETS